MGHLNAERPNLPLAMTPIIAGAVFGVIRWVLAALILMPVLLGMAHWVMSIAGISAPL
jgi:hypothetical protein